MNQPASSTDADGAVWLAYEGGRVWLRFSQMSLDGKGWVAHCDAWVDGTLANTGRLDLLDLRQRDFLASNLEERYPIGGDWSWQYAFVMATERLREHFGGSEEIIDADTIAYTELPPPIIDPLVEDTINVWAGQGGTLKSVFAVMAAHQIATGIPIIGHSGQMPRNVLILDYEEPDERTFGTRHRMIRQLYDWPQGSRKVYYRNEIMPITTTASTIRRICDRHDIGFVILDPFAYARGGAAESSADTIAAMNAVRSLRRPSLIIDHLKHDDGKGHGQDRPFGSVFTRQLTRSLWTIKKPEKHLDKITFEDQKANHRKQGGPVEYEYRWDRAGIGVNRVRRDGRVLLQSNWGYQPSFNQSDLDVFGPAQ